jgi:hypothetical protein
MEVDDRARDEIESEKRLKASLNLEGGTPPSSLKSGGGCFDVSELEIQSASRHMKSGSKSESTNTSRSPQKVIHWLKKLMVLVSKNASTSHLGHEELFPLTKIKTIFFI